MIAAIRRLWRYFNPCDCIWVHVCQYRKDGSDVE